jgi:hypothetical protein
MYIAQFPFLSALATMFGFIQPSIHYLLNQFSIAGLQYYIDKNKINTLKEGDIIQLQSDPENEYDSYAVKLLKNQTLIGYVPRSDNKHIFRLLKQGVNLHCEIIDVNPNEVAWKQCRVKVELVG